MIAQNRKNVTCDASTDTKSNTAPRKSIVVEAELQVVGSQPTIHHSTASRISSRRRRRRCRYCCQGGSHVLYPRILSYLQVRISSVPSIPAVEVLSVGIVVLEVVGSRMGRVGLVKVVKCSSG